MKGFEKRSRAILLRRAAMACNMQNKETMRLRLPGGSSSRWRLGRAMSGGDFTSALQRCEDTLQRRRSRRV
jgi:hypothetical protein